MFAGYVFDGQGAGSLVMPGGEGEPMSSVEQFARRAADQLAGFVAIMWVIVSSTAFRVLACFALAMALLMYDTLFAN